MRRVVLALGVAWVMACGGAEGFNEDTPSALCGGKAMVDEVLPKALSGDRYLAREIGVYRAPDGLFFSAGTLCVEPGVRIEVGKGGTITIGRDSEAALVAVGVDEAGAVQPIVFTSGEEVPHIGDWDKIHFTPKNRADVSRLAHVTIEFAGAYQTHGSANVTVESTEVAFEDVTIRKGQGMGLFFETPTSSPAAFRDLRFESLGLAAVALDARHLGLLEGPVTFAEADHRLEVRGGSLYGSATLHDWGAAWEVQGEGLTLQNGGVLTLEAGVRLRLDLGARVVVGGQTDAGIEVLGTAEAPVTIEPLDPPPGPAVGLWDKLILTPRTTRAVLRHLVLEGGGALSLLGGKTSLLIGGPVDEITDLGIRGSDGAAILLQQGTPVPAADQVAGIRVVDPVDAHVELGLEQAAFLAELTPVDEPLRVVVRGGALTSDATLDLGPGGLATVSGDLSVGEGARLTLASGATLAFAAGTRLAVGTEGSAGAMEAVGTDAAPITFTSAADAPAAGDWVGLRLGAGTQGTGTHLAHVTLAYGGGDPGQGAAANLALEGGDAAVDHAAFTDSAGAGLWVAAGATPTLDEPTLTFDGNAQGDLLRE